MPCYNVWVVYAITYVSITMVRVTYKCAMLQCQGCPYDHLCFNYTCCMLYINVPCYNVWVVYAITYVSITLVRVTYKCAMLQCHGCPYDHLCFNYTCCMLYINVPCYNVWVVYAITYVSITLVRVTYKCAMLQCHGCLYDHLCFNYTCCMVYINVSCYNVWAIHKIAGL